MASTAIRGVPKLKDLSEGENVLYWSETYRQWMPAIIREINDDNNTVALEIGGSDIPLINIRKISSSADAKQELSNPVGISESDQADTDSSDETDFEDDTASEAYLGPEEMRYFIQKFNDISKKLIYLHDLKIEELDSTAIVISENDIEDCAKLAKKIHDKLIENYEDSIFKLYGSKLNAICRILSGK